MSVSIYYFCLMFIKYRGKGPIVAMFPKRPGKIFSIQAYFIGLFALKLIQNNEKL